MESINREKLVFKAKMALAAKRYQDMTAAMTMVAKSVAMTDDERILLYYSYKFQFEERRESLRNLNKQLNKQLSQTEISVINGLKCDILKEAYHICFDAISLINDIMTADEKKTEANVHFFMMKGDFYRYLHECNPMLYISDMARLSYEKGRQIDHILTDTNSVKLDLIYRSALFHYRHLNDATFALALLNEGIFKFNEELKRDPSVPNDEIIAEFHKLANQIRPASPFLDTQQVFGFTDFTEVFRAVSPDLFEEADPSDDLLSALFTELSQADANFSQFFLE